ncbi:MAG: carbon-nitrogen hydrolase family protein [Flavobacteriales bacterium]|nr:carbon-nitrogen hydrolase family protein [Flavobacteriales bacterium]MBP7156423.1 carbon-nitrogen hydrolase family protein [Flavobacteriales bacterium]
MKIKIALVQMDIAPGEPLTNLSRMEEFVAKAKKKGADLVVFPEDAVCGPLQGQTAFVQHAPAYLQRMQALAVKYAVDLVPGTWTVAENGLLYNQAHYISSDGTMLGAYRKINLWETEKLSIAQGTVPVVITTRFGRVGMTICWDISFPPLFTAMNAQGVQLVISPTYWSFPDGVEKKKEVEEEITLIDSLCVTRAFENNIVFVYCNAAGILEEAGVRSVLSGRSQITHPGEKSVARCEGNKEELLIAEVDVPVQLA